MSLAFFELSDGMRLSMRYLFVFFNRRRAEGNIRSAAKIIIGGISGLKRNIANRFVGALLDILSRQSVDDFCFLNRTLIELFLEFNHVL